MDRKKTFLVVMGTIALVVALVGIPAPPVPRACGQAGGAPARSNGDVNGDGKLNVTDAVYLLRYLFQSGPPPVACAVETPGPIWPPRTGEIVNVQSQQPATLRSGMEAIYQVPDGKWLVLTDVSISLHSSGGRGVEVAEELDGKNTVKLGDFLFPNVTQYLDDEAGTGLFKDFTPRHFSSPVGVVFAPSSKVIIRDPGGWFGQRVSYHLVGYLTERH
jgi:hypothetical protein